MFEQAYQKFLEEQLHSARGMRLEQLKKHGAGEKLLLNAVVWPVFQSFEGIILEHEVVHS